jgi:hypothetical protein
VVAPPPPHFPASAACGGPHKIDQPRLPDPQVQVEAVVLTTSPPRSLDGAAPQGATRPLHQFAGRRLHQFRPASSCIRCPNGFLPSTITLGRTAAFPGFVGPEGEEEDLADCAASDDHRIFELHLVHAVASRHQSR